MNLASRSTIFLAFGPGRRVISRGVFVSVTAIMKSSKLLNSRRLLCFRAVGHCSARTYALCAVSWRGLNLRRRGSDVLRPERRGCVGFCEGSSAFPADTAVPRILKNYTTIGEFFAEAITAREVAPSAGGIALSDEFFNVGVAQFAFYGAKAKRFELPAIVVFYHREDLLELGKEILRGGSFCLREFTFVHGDVGFPDKIEHRGQGDGGVQVVREAGVKIVCRPGDAFGHDRIAAGRKFSLRESIRERTQAFDGTRGLLQAVEREIELAAIGHAR